MKKVYLASILLAVFFQIYGGFSAGLGRKTITPETPVWLSGYAARTKPSTEVLHDLWAKALVIEDEKDNRIIIVTLDIIGLSHELSEEIVKRVVEKHGISRSQLLLNSSHTHSGPVIWPSLSRMYGLSDQDLQTLIRYNRRLADDIVDVIDMAFLDLKPANLMVAHGSANIAVNRRQPTEKGFVIAVNNEGPVDPDVPVMKVETTDGKLRAILFGYACHNTTLDIYQVNGDYAGFAQIELEKANQGVTAMFMEGCGADQNPNPRRTVEYAMQHGKTLAGAVQSVLSGEFTLVRPPIRTYFTTVNLEFAPPVPNQFEEEILGEDRFRRSRAAFMLEALDKGYDISSLSYPVQAVRFNKDFTILALGGEVVVDYSLKTKKRYPNENLFVAGYSTEVQCYIPSARVLAEGGYEPDNSMIYYGLPGPFAVDVEDKITVAIDLVLKKTGAKRAR
ncbi:MAG: neutral/alkaline non-lysosomal ceramidase N-terminal domain-containing protein [Bacteroidales bacterium]